MNPDIDKIERFYSLDALRGIAALGVVFWHWQHFFFIGTSPGKFELARLPLSGVLTLLYTNGWLAVDLFFCLSGFIFYWLYSQKVATGLMSPGWFAWLRFSRLYPLHLATLAMVAVGQLFLIATEGSYWVYPYNDARHLMLNVMFVSSWGFEQGYSFNGPIWSVSVEVFLYALFFVLCRLLPVRAMVLAAVAAAGYFLVYKLYPPLGRGISSFFVGGCALLAYKAIARSRRCRPAGRLCAVLAVLAWVLTIAVGSGAFDSVLLPMGAAWTQASGILQRAWPVAVLFPLTILALALIETQRGTLGRRISVVGDISYSSYLLHFPLQLLAHVLIVRLGIDEGIYYSPGFMAVFFVVLVLTCLCSYHGLELPSQRLLRRFGQSAQARTPVRTQASAPLAGPRGDR